MITGLRSIALLPFWGLDAKGGECALLGMFGDLLGSETSLCLYHSFAACVPFLFSLVFCEHLLVSFKTMLWCLVLRSIMQRYYPCYYSYPVATVWYVLITLHYLFSYLVLPICVLCSSD